MTVAHVNLINRLFILPKRINNTKTLTTTPNSDSSMMYIFTVNYLLCNQVRYFFNLSANRLKFKSLTHIL